MEWCVNFPKEQILMSRPSLRKACGGNRNAAKFLSYLLYRVSVRENAKIEAERINDLRKQQGLEPNQDTSTSICRTQPQIVAEMDEEISERTLRDDAIPCLKELGYLMTEEIKGDKQFTIYTVDVEAAQEAINHPEQVPNFETLPYFLALNGKRKEKWKRNVSARKQLRSETLPDGSETIPHGAETLPDGHAQRLGNNSAPSNGTEDSLEAGLEGISEAPKNNKSNYKITYQEESVASATSARALSVNENSQQGDDDEIPHPDPGNDLLEPVVPATDAQASAVGTGRVATVPEREESAGHLRRAEISLEQTPFPVTSPQDGVGGNPPVVGSQGSRPRASGRRGKPQQQDVTQALSLQGAQVKEWMETIKGRKRRMTPKNVQAWNALAEEDEMSFDNLKAVIEAWESLKWVQEHDYAIDEHVLVQEDGKFTFEKGMDIVRRVRKRVSTTTNEPKARTEPGLTPEQRAKLEEMKAKYGKKVGA